MSEILLFGRIGRWVGCALVIATTACTGADGAIGPAGPSGSGSSPVFITALGSAPLIATDEVLTYALIPGLSSTVTVPAGRADKLFIETDGGIQLNSDETDAVCFIDVAIFVDGTQLGAGRRIPVFNNETVLYSVSTYGFSAETSLNAGTHTVAVMAKTYPSRVTPCYVSSGPSGS
ncbi:MAG: hypothetical protein ABI852_12225, partial [Gemmatimonadaceae bacterium]